MSDCIFCNYNASEIIAENKYTFAILDRFPVNNGHCLIITKRHFANFFEASEEEVKAIYSLLHEVKEIFDIQYEPDGYNIGINVGKYADALAFYVIIKETIIMNKEIILG